jgi:Tfp pilus assembly protein PilW
MSLRDESGLSIIELLVAMVLTAIMMTVIVNIFVSGSRAGANANDRLNAQQDTRLALDKLEFEGRCASEVGLLESGAGVAFTLPAQCAHTHGAADVSWCVHTGVLTRYVATSCAGTGVPYVRDITTADPFTLQANTGDLPQLLIAISSGSGSRAATLQDTITLRNAAVGS